MKKNIFRVVTVSCAIGLLGSCAKQKAPVALMNQADSVITNFEKKNANAFTMPEYVKAKKSLDTAKKAVEDKKYDVAKSEAKLSITNVQLATEKLNRAGAEVKLGKTEAKLDEVTSLNVKLNEQNKKMMNDMKFLEAKNTRRGIEFTLQDMMFESGKADLTAGAKLKLKKISSILNQNKDRKILIEGHTDNVGDDKYNMKLSKDRALSVQAYFIKGGVEYSRLSAVGLGETKPVAPNTTKVGKQQNRRVSVTILNK